MQPVKVLAFDLDGTLLNGAKDVTRYSRNVISQLKQQGIIIGLCSGRDLDQMEKMLPVWQMDDLASFIVASNGADYKNMQTGIVTKEPYVDAKSLKSLLRLLRRFPVSVGVIEGNQIIWNRRTIEAYAYSLGGKRVPSFHLKEMLKSEDMQNKSWPKILIVGGKAAIKAVFKKTRSLDLQRIPVGTHMIEVTDPSVSKYQALKLAMKDFDFEASEVLSFGDDINDLELLRRTRGVAMKNAKALVKEAAGTVTKYTNSQEGVAYHLNSLLLYDHCFVKEEEDFNDALMPITQLDTLELELPAPANLQSLQETPESTENQDPEEEQYLFQ